MKKHYYARLTGKVLLATIAGIITMYTIHIAIDHAFQEITTNFENLASPNQRLMAVNNLFRDITQLNNAQQAEAASGRRNPSSAFIQESRAILPKIDTLRAMFAGDTIQINRINEIEQRLILRERIFTDYMELLYAHKLNPDIRQLIDNLSEDIENRSRDNLKVVTLYETITTTTVSSDTLPGEVPGFFQRLFGRNTFPEVGGGIVETETRVDKDMVVIIDTIELQQNNNLIPILEYSLDSLHTNQLHQLAGIQKQELELINTNSSLINEINNIINSLEREEFTRLGVETRSVFDIARRTIRNLNHLAVIFISVSIVLVLLIIIDISKSNKYRKQLEQAHKEARSESDAKQRFLSNMSHEIRTPLQSIYGYTEHARIHPDQKANIEAIYLSARHLLKVVNEVLDYSKVTSGRISFEKRLFYPDRELKSVVTSMEPLAKQKDIRLRYESHLENTTALMGDPFRLRQILYNLTGNAIKFTARGEVAVNVRITSLGLQSHLIISVRDTGIGIAVERIPGLFEEYTQSSAATSDNKDLGTGLGLSIVHRLIKLQNGTIEVDSTPNEGSCFTVTIPYEIAGEEPERQKKPKSNSRDADIKPYKPKTAVVVDDDPFILNLCAVILEKQHIPYKTFKTGQDILDALNEITNAVIFLDMRMPGTSGLELYKKIREHSNNNTFKIYALTAQVLPEERKQIMDSGFDGIIIKPFKESDIMKALDKTPEKGSRNSFMFNLEPLLRMTENDYTKTKLFLGTIIKESQDDLAAIKRSSGQNRHDELILLVHRMAGRVGQTGDKEYARYLRELEWTLQNAPEPDKLKQLVHESLKRGNLFIKELKNWLLVLK